MPDFNCALPVYLRVAGIVFCIRLQKTDRMCGQEMDMKRLYKKWYKAIKCFFC